MVSGTHTIPIFFRDSYGSGMGIVWEAYHKGVPCPWGSLKIPLNQFKLNRDLTGVLGPPRGSS